MASGKKISKAKRGARDATILKKRHKKAKKYNEAFVAQEKLLDTLLAAQNVQK